jgi:hypothetical protein
MAFMSVGDPGTSSSGSFCGSASTQTCRWRASTELERGGFGHVCVFGKHVRIEYIY